MISLQQLPAIPVDILSVTATLETALCVGSGGSSGSLADQPIVRTAAGKLYIPASQLKGRVRHECEKLARGLEWSICHPPDPNLMCPQNGGDSHCLICQLFGNPTVSSKIIFDDLVCETDLQLLETIRPGVTINRRRGVSEDQKLYFLETSPMNTELEFKGEITFLSDCSEAGKILVLSALKQIAALGGSKSTGLGWLRWKTGELAITDEAWEKLIFREN
ncbi:protein of unknown function DUF324 [Halothece sp. PCC 7418]|uniref:RAMP superfamily CRISPR-associated protein n=1 Tax=Halothece sp. (strain PCC 7418) TaxID=65093 RepID=UPI0002A064FC|nr:RAMP superfamily CRISPR-associated protein [Halothece sp. PCC 7418]AFZ42900.1 protein of unknown function DUF324 [Halothece sp. PCC 7418]